MEQLVKTFGKLARFALPNEVENRDCPDGVFSLILVLRMLLGDTVSGLFYKTNWEYEPATGNTSTKLYVYDAGSKYHKGSLKEIAEVEFDYAVSIAWRTHEMSSFSYTDESCGTIRNASVESPLGGTRANPVSAITALLQLAASVGDQELLIEQIEEGRVRLARRVFGEDQTVTKETIGILGWYTSGCSRFYGSFGDCAFELV